MAGHLPDNPKTLRDAAAQATRVSLLREPHIGPLTKFVERLRATCGAARDVPYFDLFDGGVRAECLFLLEAPGARAVGSGFVSRNNPDETAKNFFLLNQEAGLPRRRTLTWNVVPWYVGTGTKIRPVTRSDIEEAEPCLAELLGMLPNLRAAVLVGRKAQFAHDVLRRMLPEPRIFACPHPSPLALNGRPHRRQEILDCLRIVVVHLEAAECACG